MKKRGLLVSWILITNSISNENSYKTVDNEFLWRETKTFGMES